MNKIQRHRITRWRGGSFDVLGCLGNAKPRVDAFAVMEMDPVVAKRPGGDVSLENRMRWHLATQACRRLGVAAPNRIADRLGSSDHVDPGLH